MSFLALESLEPGKTCTKRWLADGTKEDYPSITWWRPHPAEVRDIHHLYRCLQRLAVRPELCAVRGTLVNPSATRIRRMLAVNGGGLTDGDRPWICCDLDTMEPEQVLRDFCIREPERGIEAAGRWARDRLPGWLKHATVIAQWSASAGRDGYRQAKLHLWAWLTRPVCCDSLARYATKEPVLDPATCRTVQPIWTAAPVVLDNAPGLPTRRIMLIPGEWDKADPPREILSLDDHHRMVADADARRQAHAREIAEARKTMSRDGWKSYAVQKFHRCVERCLDDMQSAPESRRHATLIRTAACITRTARDLGLDCTHDLRLLEAVACARLPANRSGEVRQAIDYAQKTG